MIRVVVLCLWAASALWGQEWKPWPVIAAWRQIPDTHAWKLPDHFEWNDLDGHPLHVNFIRRGALDSEGVPSSFEIRAGDEESKTRASWSILDEARQGAYEPQRRIYEPFMASGLRNDPGMKLLEIGPWRVWELDIDPMTNGDPPYFSLWIVQHQGTKSLALRGISGYGLMGFQALGTRLELWGLGGTRFQGSTNLLPWVFECKGDRIISRQGRAAWVFMLGGLDGLSLASTEVSAGRQGVTYFARAIERADKTGGTALPNTHSLAALPMTQMKDWFSEIPHYSTEDWSDLHWAWTSGDWHQPPKRAMVHPSADKVPFKWGPAVTVFNTKTDWYEFKSVKPEEAALLAGKPGWKVVLVKEPDAGPTAVSLIPPNF